MISHSFTLGVKNSDFIMVGIIKTSDSFRLTIIRTSNSNKLAVEKTGTALNQSKETNKSTIFGMKSATKFVHADDSFVMT